MKRIILFCVIALLATACNNTKPSFKVTVNLANADGSMVYLLKDSGTEAVKIDSVTIDNGTAVFQVPVAADNEMYSITTEGFRRPLSFFTDNKDVIISGDKQKPNDIEIQASETQQRLNAFTKDFNAFDQQLDSISALIKQAQDANDIVAKGKLDTAYLDKEEEQKMFCFNYIWDNKSDVVSHYLLYRYKWAFGPCEIHYMIDNLDTLVTSGNLDKVKAYVAALDRVSEGQPYLDFTQNDVNGNPVTLSQLAGGTKLLLVDFWASWCPDCRKENPNVVAAYNKYHEQGFDVLGVSFDTDKEAWKAAITKDGLVWNQVSDLQGWNNAAGGLYSIAFIPQNVLLKDGVIVARNLSGDALMTSVEENLK